jgi:hypothetical protein
MRARIFFVVLLLAPFARAETYTSVSRQFVIHHSGARPLVDNIPPGSVEVVPELLAVTAERVKQAVTHEISATSGSSSIIHVGLIDKAAPNSDIGIASSLFADGWRYEVAVPRVVEEAHLVKAFINVVLLEYANRGSDRGAETPVWVTEGLAAQIQFSFGPRLVVDRSPTAWEGASRDMQHWTRETLRTNNAPTFQELTTSAVPPAKSPGEPIYRASAHLLVHALLESQNGRAKFANFIQELPRTWNWQTAFMKSFGFERMLDVEKWWALTVTDFSTRDLRQAWSTSASLRKLDELLQTRLEYHTSTNALPEPRLVDLTTLLREMDPEIQRQALEEKISQLTYTAPLMAPQVGSIAVAYKEALKSCLQKQAALGTHPSLRSTPAAQRQAIVGETIRRIAAIDAKAQAIAEQTLSSAK